MIKSQVFVILSLVLISIAQSTITIPCAVTAYTWDSTYTTTTTTFSTRNVIQTEIYISTIITATQSTTENFFVIPTTQLVCGFTTTEVTGLQTRTLLESSVGKATRTNVRTSVITPMSCTSFVTLTTTVTVTPSATNSGLPDSDLAN